MNFKKGDIVTVIPGKEKSYIGDTLYDLDLHFEYEVLDVLHTAVLLSHNNLWYDINRFQLAPQMSQPGSGSACPVQLPLPAGSIAPYPARAVPQQNPYVNILYGIDAPEYQAIFDRKYTKTEYSISSCSHTFRPSKTMPGMTKWCMKCDHRE